VAQPLEARSLLGQNTEEQSQREMRMEMVAIFNLLSLVPNDN
jgi:hypothetical protein